MLTHNHLIKLLGEEFASQSKGVSEVMDANILSLGMDSVMSGLINRMGETASGCVLIEDESKALVGIVTERDIVRLVAEGCDFASTVAGDVMTGSVVSIDNGASLLDALNIMESSALRRLAVVDDAGRALGLITQLDVEKWLENGYKRSLLDMVTDTKKKLKTAIEQLNEKGAYLENILSSAMDYSIITTDLDLNINYHNSLAETLYDRNSEGFEGKTVMEIHETEDVSPERLEMGLAALAQNGVHNYENRTPVDGVERVISARISVIKDQEGVHIGYAHFSKDVTEEKRKEIELKKLSHAIFHSPHTVIITDSDGLIEYANPKFTELTGYTFEEVRSKNPRILQSGIMDKKEYETLWRTIKGGKRWTGLFCNKKKNGDIYWESAAINPVKNDDGEITNFIAIKEDISEKMKIEDDRERLIVELETALKNIRHLTGLLPICSYCKKIRDNKGYWNKVETYIEEHTEAEFTHGICEACAKNLIDRSKEEN